MGLAIMVFLVFASGYIYDFLVNFEWLFFRINPSELAKYTEEKYDTLPGGKNNG